MRAYKEKKKSQDGKTPNPFLFAILFCKYECDSDPTQISLQLSGKEKVDSIIKKYKVTLGRYYRGWVKKNPGKEYNDMIKSQVDISIFDEEKDSAEDMLAIDGLLNE